MKTTHILDTSALLVHFQEEPGFEVVEALVANESNRVRVSCLTWFEFSIRLREICVDERERRTTMERYREIMGHGLPADDAVVARAISLRKMAQSRLPAMDALIAATAGENSAILVHRDPHLAAIPTAALPQIILPDKTP